MQTRKTRDGSGQREGLPWGATAFLLLVLSGFFNLLSSSWSPFFRLNLFLHPLLGILVVAGAIRSAATQLRSRIPALSPAVLIAFQVLVFLGFFRAFVFRHYAIGASNAFSALALLPIVILGVFLYRRGRHIAAADFRSAQASGQAARMLAWGLAAASGLSIFLAGGGRPAAALADFHTAVAVIVAVTGMIALLRHTRASISRNVRALGLAAAVATIVPLVVNGVGYQLQSRPAATEATVHLSTIPLDRRLPEERDPLPNPIGAEWIDITASCGEAAACHREILDDHRHSLHAISYHTPHLQKNLLLLAEEIGPQNQVLCAGCHTPAVFFSGGGQRAEDYRQGDNVSCVFCHVISDVSLPQDGRKSSYTIDLPVDHLSMFLGAERAGGRLSALNRLLIQLNPSAHGRVFRRPLYKEDRYCMACHHLQLRGMTAGRTCVQCHMEPRDALGLAGKGKNHFFPGANTSVPLLTGFEDYAALNERWMQGLLLRRSLGNPYDVGTLPPVLPDLQRLKDFYYLAMSAQFDPPPARGQATRLRIETHNTGIEHGFPTSALDLEEAWLEVRVTDETGRLLFASGGLDAAQEVLPDSHKMGGHMIGLDGQLVTHNRVWQIRDKVIDRMILPDQTGVDDFPLQLPVDCGNFITVEAAWRYRKLNRNYWVWAYGSDTTIPSPVVARALRQFRVTGVAIAGGNDIDAGF